MIDRFEAPDGKEKTMKDKVKAEVDPDADGIGGWIEIDELPDLDEWEDLGYRKVRGTEPFRAADDLSHVVEPSTKAAEGKYRFVVHRERWKPEYGEKYWYINSFIEVESGYWNCSINNEQRWKACNIFRTKEQAYEAMHEVRELLKEESEYNK